MSKIGDKFGTWLNKTAGNFGDWIKSNVGSGKFRNWIKTQVIPRIDGSYQTQQQMELAKYQASLNEEYYNNYSSPSALMQQYREAGLNPNLMYGGAGSGQGNVPQVTGMERIMPKSPSEKLAHALSFVGQIYGIRQMAYQTDAAREAVEGQILDNALKREQISSRDLTNRYQSLLYGLNLFNVGGTYRNSRRASGTYADSSIGSVLPSYIQSARDLLFYRSDLIRLQGLNQRGQNLYNYGILPDGSSDPRLVGDSIYYNRAKSFQLNYQIESEMKKWLYSSRMLGSLAPFIVPLLQKGLRSF